MHLTLQNKAWTSSRLFLAHLIEYTSFLTLFVLSSVAYATGDNCIKSSLAVGHGKTKAQAAMLNSARLSCISMTQAFFVPWSLQVGVINNSTGTQGT